MSAYKIKQNTKYFLFLLFQFLFQTLDKLEMPEFVDPTKPSGHVFKVYVGSTLSIKLHAKPNDATLE